MNQNSIRLFSEDELRAALSLVGTPESAMAVAAELYALPDEEQRCYHWINTTLMLLSSVSDDLARRVLDRFGDTPPARARHEAERKTAQEWIGQRSGKPGIKWVLADVVHDTRQDAAFMRAFRNDEPGRRYTNYIALFTQSELRGALSAIGSSEASAAVAAEIYGLPSERQVNLDWTDLSLGLIAHSSSDLTARIEKVFGDTAERQEQLREMHQLFRELIASGELKAVGTRLDLGTVVRPVQGRNAS